jgi:hypothetical protein
MQVETRDELCEVDGHLDTVGAKLGAGDVRRQSFCVVVGAANACMTCVLRACVEAAVNTWAAMKLEGTLGDFTEEECGHRAALHEWIDCLYDSGIRWVQRIETQQAAADEFAAPATLAGGSDGDQLGT